MGINFQDLPVDLLPCILHWLSFRLSDLSHISQVSQLFRQAALPFLYERIRVRDIRRLKLLFETLSTHPQLAIHLRTLELRVWPLATNDPGREALERQVVMTLNRAFHLDRLDFTRRGSMTDEMFHALAQRTSLKTLELNGSPLYFSPAAILQLPPQLSSLQILLPNRDVMDYLPAALEKIRPSLRSLTLLGSKSTSIQNSFIHALLPLQLQLHHLALVGCPRLTDDPLLDLLLQQGPHLRSLALEALGTSPMFLAKVSQHVDLNQLKTFKTTIDPRVALVDYPDPSFASLAKLVTASSGLESLGFYSSGHHTDRQGALTYPVIPKDFITSLTRSRCATHLTMFECYGIVCPMSQVEVLCSSLPNLRHFGLHVWSWPQHSEVFEAALNELEDLECLHLLSVKEAEPGDAQALLTQLQAPHLRQFGVRNRVWDVGRHVNKDGHVSKTLEPFDWSSQQIPSIFMFIRS